MQRGGSIGISFLTEPKHFKGSIERFREARRMINLPFLMKDFILDPVQIDAASKIGGDAVLLIQALFDRGYCHLSRDEMIQNAHSLGLEVLLESHTRKEFQKTLDSQADLIGINNRDLSTLTVNIETTKEILESSTVGERVIISESGIETPQHVKLLRKWGAQGFLVGTAVMAASNIEEKVRELMEA